jgi:glucose-1-phosphate adenylyltransferase
MAEYLNDWTLANSGSAKISVLPPLVGSFRGTADAVYRNLNYLDSQTSDRVLILAGDHVYRMDYRKMLAFHESAKADVTVGVIRVPVEEAQRFGTVVIDGDKRIHEFIEKSSNPLSTLASMGIYIFNRNTLIDSSAKDATIQDSVHDFGYSILPSLVKRERVFAYEFAGYWQDIGTVEAYYQANMDLLAVSPRFSLDCNWPVLTDHNALPMPQQSKDGKVMNSLVSQGCIINGHVENSVLSPGVYVEKDAIVRDSVVMANTVVGFHSIVDSCIVDEGVQIGELCYLGCGRSLIHGQCALTVIGKDVAIPNHTTIGRKCKVLPKAELDDFAGGVVPPGTVIRSGVMVP